MSTFKGFMEEIPGVAVDRFDGDCLSSKYLFLSHCHADHMVGLSSIFNLTVPIFASEISAVFLRKQFPNISNAIETIEIEVPIQLSFRVDEKDYLLEVTALSAKHCPGSVMFLFETEKLRVLYTGDFRILKKDFNQYDCLKTKPINSIHLDSTFLSDKFYEFPTQMESINQICSLIKEWLELDPENKILIEMPAQYGIEFIFIAIERQLKEKIHVNRVQWEKYVYLPAMDDCISPDAAKCRIFTKFKGPYGGFTEYSNNYRIIKPSALFWANWKQGEPIFMQVGYNNEYRVAYSNHSSCSELKDFLNFIQPKKVHLNVLPEYNNSACIKCLDKIYPRTKKENLDKHESSIVEKVCFDNIFFVPTTEQSKKESSNIKLPPKRLKL